MERIVRTCDRGGQIVFGALRVGVMRAEVVDGVPFAQVMTFESAESFECILEKGWPTSFTAGRLALLDVEPRDPEPRVTFEFIPAEP